MKKNIIYIGTSLLMMISCSSEIEMEDAFAKPIPIEFSVSAGEQNVTTRATANPNGSSHAFTAAMSVGVAMTNNSNGLWDNWGTKKYKVSTSTAKSAITAATTSDAFYFYRPSDKYKAIAWHLGLGKNCGTEIPSSFTVYADQSNPNISASSPLSENDFLYAKPTEVAYWDADKNVITDHTLTMVHQNAMLDIVLTLGGTDLTAADITGMTIASLNTEGQWTSNHTSTTNEDPQYGTLSNPQTMRFRVITGGKEYRLVVIPQSLNDKVLTIENKKGYDLKYTFGSGDVLAGNQWVKYTLTIGENVKLLQSTIEDWELKENTSTVNITEIK